MEDGERGRKAEKEGVDKGERPLSVSADSKTKNKKKKKSGRKKNAHNAVISVFDLPISLWGYYMGSPCAQVTHTRSVDACSRSGKRARESTRRSRTSVCDRARVC